MNVALKTVIRAFQTEVQRGLALFQQHRGLNDIRSWRDHGLTRTGYLDADEHHEYFFHGIGCRLQLGPDLSIDWDFGHDGRMDGFDLWRLKLFLEERPEFQRILPLDVSVRGRTMRFSRLLVRKLRWAAGRYAVRRALVAGVPISAA